MKKGNSSYFANRRKMILTSSGNWIVLVFSLLIFSCNKPSDRESKTRNTLFAFKKASSTNVHFKNQIFENDTFNIIDNYSIYNGGGVGVGDFNKDGLPDVFFAGNMVSSKLYLNQGNFVFEDVTEVVDLVTENWISGVSVADIDGNGWPDIYLSSGVACENGCENLLFLNYGIQKNGSLLFKEMAKEAGLQDESYVTHAAFFDYDLDGDLDVYLLKNAVDRINKNTVRTKEYLSGKGHTNDRLLRNDGIVNNQLSFTDVSIQAGIVNGGYGLGIAVTDFNQDGWPDVYVTNDFVSNDLIYINQKNGVFKNMADEITQSQSYNAMGCDAADINNDGLYDLMSLDMLPEDNRRQKTMLSGPNYNFFNARLDAGYQPQFMRNTVQLGNGSFDNGQVLPFSEVGRMMGVEKTDWSWAPLLIDLDNNGHKDIYISNGYVRDMTDKDFINNRKFALQFGLEEAKMTKLKELYNTLEGAYLSNYTYSNSGDLKFENVSESWGLKMDSYSQGVAYADLDADGDLDLVVNNLNDTAFVIQNKSVETLNHSYLQIQLKGNKMNKDAFGSEVRVYTGDKMQIQYNSPYRGYLSTMENLVHFGFSSNSKIDSLLIRWPDQRVQKIVDISLNQRLVIEKAVNLPRLGQEKSKNLIFKETELKGFNYSHKEDNRNDFDIQPLLLNMYSRKGAVIAESSVTEKGGRFVFVGSSFGQESIVFKETEKGTFQKFVLEGGTYYEDVSAVWLDIDQDKDEDLIVLSGGGIYPKGHSKNKNRVYLNEGNGFRMQNEIILDDQINNAVVVQSDFDHDGDMDLFLGGGIVPGSYPQFENSSLYLNEKGVFKKDINTKLDGLTIVNDAVWLDIDNDGWEDLVVVGEWGPVRVFKNDNGKLVKYQLSDELSKLKGWWSTIEVADLNNDGYQDLVIGNVGLNTPFIAEEEFPFELYVKDFDNNGTIDPIYAGYLKNAEWELDIFPYHPLEPLSKQIVSMKSIYKLHKDFSLADIEEVLGKENLKSALKLELNFRKTIILMNTTDGQFKLKDLPSEIQFSPVRAIEIFDFDNDGDFDIVFGGNLKSVEDMGGWYDASLGNLLKNDGQANFEIVANRHLGLLLNGEVSDLETMRLLDGREILMVTKNDEPVKFYEY